MFTDPEDVQISVSASALDVAVVRAVPLIERFENVDPMSTELKSPGHGQSAMVACYSVLLVRLLARVIRDLAPTPRISTGQPSVVEPLLSCFWFLSLLGSSI
jgi:hypothetical protein